ncbi:beta-CASP ribonuclease aCPSF1 [Candidatus Woesearchaeota archaeon]|nr:beta-CASP ribonuclease aCPSF1 [Candidatus Woesearchaeota archaeon]
MADILQEILKYIPESANVSDTLFEGANIVVYTKNKEFFFNSNGIIKKIVDDIKKRVEIRPDPSICLDPEKAKEIIENIIPKDAGIVNIIFDNQRSRVIIEAEKPGLVIGKQGELLKEIKKQTLWVPYIQRTPAIRSKLIENIRYVLYENSDFRRKFLHKIGKRIYGGWTKEKKHEWVRVTYLGAGRQVGRSCLLLQTPESKVLLDCGINPGKSLNDSEAFPYFDAPEFNINDIDAVILTHSHLDHSALVPYLYKMGYDGPVYCTAPCRDITALMTLDFIGISQKEGQDPMYTSSDIKNMVKHTVCLNYEEVTDITPDIRLTFYNAGHTLGSAICHLHIGNGLHNLVYTGDFLYESTNLLAPAVNSFPRVESVIMEATYGGKDDINLSRKECESYLLDIIKNTIDRKGKILMPVLGVGRSQEIMLIIERAIRENLIPSIPIYLQGILWDVTAIHTTYPDFFNPKVKRNIFHRDENPFLSDIFKQIGSQKEQQQVIDKGESCIILATSGMMNGGASKEYFRQLAENPKHSLIFTCYQVEGSLGRRIVNGEREINFGSAEKQDMLSVKMDVHLISGFSGHSSRVQLLNYIKNMDPKPRRILTLHGESSKCLDLSSSLHKLNQIETEAPRNLESIRLK